MKAVHDTRLLYQRFALQILRNPVWLAVGFSTPILYLALFTPLLKHFTSGYALAGHAAPGSNVLDGFLPGILALLAFGSAIGAGFSTIFELRAGVIERFRVTPASRVAILLGPILANMTLMFVFDLVVVAIGAAFGFHIHWVGLLILIVPIALLMVTFSAFSIATALLTKEISGFAAIVNGLNLPILLLAGVLLPISVGPTWMRVLAHFNPLYYLVSASRQLAAGHLGSTDVWLAFAVLVPLCVLVVAWASGIVRRAVA
jgi:ABC-2 type transport system permease protein